MCRFHEITLPGNEHHNPPPKKKKTAPTWVDDFPAFAEKVGYVIVPWRVKSTNHVISMWSQCIMFVPTYLHSSMILYCNVPPKQALRGQLSHSGINGATSVIWWSSTKRTYSHNLMMIRISSVNKIIIRIITIVLPTTNNCLILIMTHHGLYHSMILIVTIVEV